jgi:hypothetical protein
MTGKYHDPDEGNRRYQRTMAQALVAGLGRDAALEVCANNGWEGVVKALLPPHCRSRDIPASRRTSSIESNASG